MAQCKSLMLLLFALSNFPRLLNFNLLSFMISSIGLMQIYKKMNLPQYKAWIPVYRIFVLSSQLWSVWKYISYLLVSVIQQMSIIFMAVMYVIIFYPESAEPYITQASSGNEMLTLGLIITWFSLGLLILQYIIWWGFCRRLGKEFQASVFLSVITLFAPWIGYLILGIGSYEYPGYRYEE